MDVASVARVEKYLSIFLVSDRFFMLMVKECLFQGRKLTLWVKENSKPKNSGHMTLCILV